MFFVFSPFFGHSKAAGEMEVIGLSICGGVQISAATCPACFVCMRVFFDLSFDPS